MFKLSMFLFILTLNIKSELDKVFDFNPNPSDPNKSTFLPFQLFSVKSFFAETSNALIQKSFVFKYLVVLIFETLKIFICSAPPLALL